MRKVIITAAVTGSFPTKEMRASGVKPEIEVFDTGQIFQAIDLITKGDTLSIPQPIALLRID